MSDEESKQFIEKHPKKKKLMVEALGEYITQPKETFANNPDGMATYLLHKTDYGGDPPERDTGGLPYAPDGPVIPSTEDIANGTAKWVEEKLLGAVRGALKPAIGFVVGTTHPVNSGAFGIFGTPTNQPYKGLYKSVYGPYSFLYAIVILLILLLSRVIVMPWSGLVSGGSYRATQAIAAIFAAVMLVMFWWPIGTALAQFFDAIAVSIAPTAKELTSSMSGLFKLSLGPILALIAIYVVGLGEVLGLMFVYGFRQAAIILFQFAMPLLLVFAYAGPHRRIRSMASTIVWQYFALLVMTIPTAFILRIAFEAGWAFGLGVLGNAIISMMLLALALATPFVFSIAAFRAPPSIRSVASGAAGAAVGAGASAKKRVTGNKEEGYEEEDYEEAAPSGSTYNTVLMMGPNERVAATDGGTPTYGGGSGGGATAKGPGAVGELGSGAGNGGTAERIRNMEQQSNGQSGGSATAQTRHYNNQRDNDVIDVDGGVIDEEDN
ncbi:MAG TPA: hypothetical protein VFJ06_06500 [Halococcus sp.]|nr:hypothetical protein [Halococcus sp.]